MTSCAGTTAQKIPSTESTPTEIQTPIPTEQSESQPAPELVEIEEFHEPPVFTNMHDPELLQYMEDNIYAELVDTLQSEDYIIENIETVFISKEYLEELNYNSQANVFFGYTLAELDEQFQGTRYVFTLGEDGQTTVVPFEAYDDTYEQVLKNVAVGTGVILVCVTVSVVTAGAGLAPVSVVFAAAAKGAAIEGLSNACFGAIAAGIVEGTQTGDFDAALKAAALAGSEGFKWGAITGAIVSGATELRTIRHAAQTLDRIDDITDIANAADDVVDNLDDILRGAKKKSAGSIEIPDDLQPWQKAELRALNEKGGYDQLAFQNGQRVAYNAKGATRPDVIRIVGDHLEAVEVKYYDLSNPNNCKVLYNELHREVADRIIHLPDGSTQRIILDVTDRRFDPSIVEEVVKQIRKKLQDIYPNIPIDVVGLT